MGSGNDQSGPYQVGSRNPWGHKDARLPQSAVFLNWWLCKAADSPDENINVLLEHGYMTLADSVRLARYCSTLGRKSGRVALSQLTGSCIRVSEAV